MSKPVDNPGLRKALLSWLLGMALLSRMRAFAEER